MAIVTKKRHRGEDEPRRPKKKIRNFKKQAEYHSSSEDDDEDVAAPIRRDFRPLSGANRTRPGQKTKSKEVENRIAAAPEPAPQQAEESDEEEIDETTINTALNMATHESDEEEEEEGEGGEENESSAEPLQDEQSHDEQMNDEPAIDDEQDDLDIDELDDDEPDVSSDEESQTSGAAPAARKKRNDPDAFATSISKILTTKLSTNKRSDPILSRSKTADEANKALADEKLETKARAAIRAEKKSLLERGRVKDVLGLETAGVDTGAIQEEEKRFKKIAQRGVVKLFNAVRAAQVRAEEAVSQARAEGVVGIRKKEERVNEMSKEGFLDLISRGGKKSVKA